MSTPSTTTPSATPSTAPAAIIESPLVELHRAAGVELAPYFGVMLPARFCDPVQEYRMARQNVALIDTNFRAVFSLSGTDRARYLNAVSTGNVRGLAVGQGTIGLLLNNQGHILAELETLALEDRILIVGHAFLRERTFATLDKFIVMDDATLADETTETGTLAIEGPAVPAILRELTGVDYAALCAASGAVSTATSPSAGVPASATAECAPLGTDRNHVAVMLNIPSDASSDAPLDKLSSAASNDSAPPVAGRAVRRSLYGFPGVEFLVPRADLPRVWRALAAAVARHGGAPIGYATLNALRLEAGVKWIGTDFDDHQIPHEAGLEGTHISFTKGCYTGQEIVERVRSRGHVNRRLTGLAFGGIEPPQHGSALTVALAGSTVATAGSAAIAANAPTTGAEAGIVTSAAFSPLLGRAIGMGYVRREYVAQQLQCGSGSAEVIDLPLPGALPSQTA